MLSKSFVNEKEMLKEKENLKKKLMKTCKVKLFYFQLENPKENLVCWRTPVIQYLLRDVRRKLNRYGILYGIKLPLGKKHFSQD